MTHLTKALEGVVLPEQVYLPPSVTGDKAGRKNKTVEAIQKRIMEDCDPIGQLMAIANGMPVASFHVDAEGKVTIKYETANLSTRIKILEGMREKLIPNVSKNQPKPKEDKEDDSWESLTQRRSAQMVGEEPERSS